MIRNFLSLCITSATDTNNYILTIACIAQIWIPNYLFEICLIVCNPHTLTAHTHTHTHATQTTVHASQSPQQPHAQHRILRQPHKQTKGYHRTTNTTQTHRPSSKSVINLIILQVNMNGLRNKLEELKLLIHDTHADIITIQKTKLTHKAKTPKIHNFTEVRTEGCTRQEVGSLHSLEITSHSLQQTYLRLLIHTPQNFKWSRYTLTTLNLSQ